MCPEQFERHMSSPTVSVIVPVYNTAEYLPCCLDSLINQTYPHIEILCVDDGSTDNSWQILQEYAAKDSRIKIFHQENAGVSTARNKALDHATGEYLSFVDSDDWLEADTFELCIASLDEDIEIICFSVQAEYNSPSNLTFVQNFQHNVKSTKKIQIDTNFILKHQFDPKNKLIKRSIQQQYNIYFPHQLAYAEDCVVGLCIYACKPNMNACIISAPLYHYRKRQGSAMAEAAKKNERGIQQLYAMEHVYRFMSSHSKSEEFMKAYPIIFWYFANMALDTTPDNMHDFVVSEIKRIATLQDIQPVGYMENRLRRISTFEKNFHWFRGCTECFGFKGKSIWSITCQPTEKQYRFMGCLVYRCKYPILIQTTSSI